MSGRPTKVGVEGLNRSTKQGEQSLLWEGELKGFGVLVVRLGLKMFTCEGMAVLLDETIRYQNIAATRHAA